MQVESSVVGVVSLVFFCVGLALSSKVPPYMVIMCQVRQRVKKKVSLMFLPSSITCPCHFRQRYPDTAGCLRSTNGVSYSCFKKLRFRWGLTQISFVGRQNTHDFGFPKKVGGLGF